MTDVTGQTPMGKTAVIANVLAAASQAGFAVVVDDGPLELSRLSQWPNIQLGQRRNGDV